MSTTTTTAHVLHAQQTTTQASDSSMLILGPKPYNRFLGNPPKDTTPEDDFKNEMGYPWIVEISAQPLLDKINKLEAQNAQLQTEVNQLKASQVPATHK